MVVLLLVVQVGLVVRDQLLVVHAAREAARAASVGDAADRGAAGRRAGPVRWWRRACTSPVADGGPGVRRRGRRPLPQRDRPPARRSARPRRRSHGQGGDAPRMTDRCARRVTASSSGGEQRLAAGRRRPACRAARCRCRTWATARTTGSPTRTGRPRSPRGWPPGGGRRWRSRARRCRRRRGSRRRSTIVGRPVSAWSAVDTPPTSQRSQMVNSGSRPMAACSTACSVPGTCGRADAGRGQQRLARPCTRRPA